MENSFGEFLKQKRQEKKLTQKELAELLIISPSTVSKWEKGVAHPDITLLPKLSEILGVTEHELITASVDKESREEKSQAKKWRVCIFSWSLFFYIAYVIALIPCFICNIALVRSKVRCIFRPFRKGVFLGFPAGRWCRDQKPGYYRRSGRMPGGG